MPQEKQQCVYCKKFFTIFPGYYPDACTDCTDDCNDDEEFEMEYEDVFGYEDKELS